MIESPHGLTRTDASLFVRPFSKPVTPQYQNRSENNPDDVKPQSLICRYTLKAHLLWSHWSFPAQLDTEAPDVPGPD